MVPIGHVNVVVDVGGGRLQKHAIMVVKSYRQGDTHYVRGVIFVTIVDGFAGGVRFITLFIDITTDTVSPQIATLRRGTFSGTVRNRPIVGAILYGVSGIKGNSQHNKLVRLGHGYTMVFGFGVNAMSYNAIGVCSELDRSDTSNEVACVAIIV